jgi:hypothetical protein
MRDRARWSRRRGSLSDGAMRTRPKRVVVRDLRRPLGLREAALEQRDGVEASGAQEAEREHRAGAGGGTGAFEFRNLRTPEYWAARREWFVTAAPLLGSRMAVAASMLRSRVRRPRQGFPRCGGTRKEADSTVEVGALALVGRSQLLPTPASLAQESSGCLLGNELGLDEGRTPRGCAAPPFLAPLLNLSRWSQLEAFRKVFALPLGSADERA